MTVVVVQDLEQLVAEERREAVEMEKHQQRLLETKQATMAPTKALIDDAVEAAVVVAVEQQPRPLLLPLPTQTVVVVESFVAEANVAAASAATEVVVAVVVREAVVEVATVQTTSSDHQMKRVQ